MFSEKVLARIKQELTAAENARTEGNEGKARVCARRAAGIAIQEYYISMGEQVAVNVIEALHILKSDSRVDPDWRTFADLLLTRVTENHTFPVEKDVLAETRQFIHEIENTVRGKSFGK